MRHIRLGLKEKTVAEKTAQGQAIKAAMTDNPDFENPYPSLATLETVVTNLQAAQTARDDALLAARMATCVLHKAEVAYDACVTQLGLYAENVTGFDVAKLRRGGFQLRKERTRVTSLEQVQDLRLITNLHPGRLVARWDPLPGAQVFEVQISTDDPNRVPNWRSVTPTTAASAELEGLTSGARVWARVRGVNGDVVGPWSEAVSKIVP